MLYSELYETDSSRELFKPNYNHNSYIKRFRDSVKSGIPTSYEVYSHIISCNKCKRQTNISQSLMQGLDINLVILYCMLGVIIVILIIDLTVTSISRIK